MAPKAKPSSPKSAPKSSPKTKPAAAPTKAAAPKVIKTQVKGKKVAKLRKSISPGTVLILLSGHFRGKRVVFLKQLESGLLLVTGPYAVNGVPLRRVNQRYVIATSTKVDMGKTDLGKFDDKYFAHEKEKKKGKSEDQFFAQEKEKKEVSAARKSDQKAVDTHMVAHLSKAHELKKYLKARFSLTNTMYPHQLKF